MTKTIVRAPLFSPYWPFSQRHKYWQQGYRHAYEGFDFIHGWETVMTRHPQAYLRGFLAGKLAREKDNRRKAKKDGGHIPKPSTGGSSTPPNQGSGGSSR